MERWHVVLCALLTVLATGVSLRWKDFSQPDKVFIATPSASASVRSAQEAAVSYLGDAMNDVDGDLVVSVSYGSKPDPIWGEVEYPPTSSKWYFKAEWRMTTTGGGYLFFKITHDQYVNSPWRGNKLE
jgi:hypothetical protein